MKDTRCQIQAKERRNILGDRDRSISKIHVRNRLLGFLVHSIDVITVAFTREEIYVESGRIKKWKRRKKRKIKGSNRVTRIFSTKLSVISFAMFVLTANVFVVASRSE